MPYSFHVLPTLNLVVFQPIGVLSEADVLHYFAELRADPAFAQGMNRLVDNQSLDDVDMSYAQIRNIQANERHLPNAENRPRTAFVTYGAKGFGMARMYASVAEGRNLQHVAIFGSLADSAEFLGPTTNDLSAAIANLPPAGSG